MKIDALRNMSECSRVALNQYLSFSKSKEGIKFRFFSYGSNMNEGKFIEDVNHKFGLLKAKKSILSGYKRILGNKSKNHGLAFTICQCEGAKVEGICHDVPKSGLISFLRKEGVLLEEPKYELLVVKISDEETPVLTLKGLKPLALASLTRKQKLNAYCYLKASVIGAKKWKVNHRDMLELLAQIENEMCS